MPVSISLVASCQYFDARFDGQVDTADVPKGRLTIDAAGTPKLISIRKLNYDVETIHYSTDVL